ncbi:MAG: hypothetical protein PVG83_13525, partial [Acidimicrobiia bacterium]
MTMRPGYPTNRALLGLLVTVLGSLLMVGCSAGIGEDAGSPFDPEARAVRLEITGCESGSRARFGSG